MFEYMFLYYYDAPGVSSVRGRLVEQNANGVMIEPLTNGVTSTSARSFYPWTAIQRMTKA